MKKMTNIFLSLLMVCALCVPVSAADKEKGKLYLGEEEVSNGTTLNAPSDENNYFSKTYEIPGATSLVVKYQTKAGDGTLQTFTDETVKCDTNSCTVKYRSLGGVGYGQESSAFFTYTVDGKKEEVAFTLKGNAPGGGAIASSFMYNYVGDYDFEGKTYTVNYSGNAVTINGNVVSDVILGSGELYTYKLEYDGQTFAFAFHTIDEDNYVKTTLINGQKVQRHLMDLEAVGLETIQDGLKESVTKTITVAKGETVEVIAKNVSGAIPSMEWLAEDCYQDLGGPADHYDHVYPHDKLDNGYKLRVKLNDLGTFCVGWNFMGVHARFRFIVVKDKAEVISQMTQENAKETITAMQHVETPNNANVTVEDIKKIESFYPDVVETTYSGDASKAFEVSGLAPALIKIEDAKEGQEVNLKVDEKKTDLQVDGVESVLKTLDIVVSSKDASMSTTELQIPVSITFDAKELGIEVMSNQELKVVREHNGIQEMLDVVETADGKYSFVTDKFSTYAIVAVKKEEKPSAPSISCAGSKDKNCDGVITCEEEKGKGWIWNNTQKVCEYNPNAYTVVNTGVK